MYKIIQGDVIAKLREIQERSKWGGVQCCVTSPPYWGLRDYGDAGQIGLEKTLEAYVSKLVEVFREVWRVLRHDGTLWLNLGDSYNNIGGGTAFNEPKGSLLAHRRLAHEGVKSAKVWAIGLKPKDLCGIPWRVAFALQADGWYLRSDIIWSKPNPMPESVTDRPTKSHEYLFLFSKHGEYFYNADAIKEYATPQNRTGKNGGYQCPSDILLAITGKRHGATGLNGPSGESRNKHSVWTVPTKPYSQAHFAVFPPKLIEPCILAGSREGDTILDPFAGSGTTGMVAVENFRKAILIELNPNYVKLMEERCAFGERKRRFKERQLAKANL